MDIEVFVEICREGTILPKYARPGDAGMDVFAAEDVIIRPGETVIIPTGIKMVIPEGYELQVRPRSGISYKTPLRIANSPGTIDSGYRDELGIIMNNSSVTDSSSDTRDNSCFLDTNHYNNHKNGNEILTLESKGNKIGTYIIKKGDRVAQIVLQRVPKIKFTIVDSVEEKGCNRGGGFGSTGI